MAEESLLKDPEVESCLAAVAEARQRLSGLMARAKAETILNPLDWRRWFRDYPVECTLGVAAVGFLAGTSPSTRGDGREGLLEELTRTGIETVLRTFLSSA